MKIVLTGEYIELLAKLVARDEETEVLVSDTLKLFEKNYKDTRLGVHALTKRMSGKWAMGIMGDELSDLRIVFEWLGKDKVRLLAIGLHSVVYGRVKKKELMVSDEVWEMEDKRSFDQGMGIKKPAF